MAQRLNILLGGNLCSVRGGGIRPEARTIVDRVAAISPDTRVIAINDLPGGKEVVSGKTGAGCLEMVNNASFVEELKKADRFICFGGGNIFEQGYKGISQARTAIRMDVPVLLFGHCFYGAVPAEIYRLVPDGWRARALDLLEKLTGTHKHLVREHEKGTEARIVHNILQVFKRSEMSLVADERTKEYLADRGIRKGIYVSWGGSEEALSARDPDVERVISFLSLRST